MFNSRTDHMHVCVLVTCHITALSEPVDIFCNFLQTISLTYTTHSCPVAAYQVSCCCKSTLWSCILMRTVRHVTGRKRRINSGSVGGCDVSYGYCVVRFITGVGHPDSLAEGSLVRKPCSKIFFVPIYGFLCLSRYSNSVSASTCFHSVRNLTVSLVFM
jgi:hypothetical protein